MDVRFCVQALFEYTPTFTAVTVPDDGIAWFTLNKPAVVTVRNVAIAMMAITAPMEIF